MTSTQTERSQIGPDGAEIRFPYWECGECPYSTTDPEYAAAHDRTHVLSAAEEPPFIPIDESKPRKAKE